MTEQKVEREIERTGCTGWSETLEDGTVVISHDGDTCPIHEADEPMETAA